MAICLGYYELSLLLVLVFQFLRRNPKKYSRHLLLFSRSAVRTKKMLVFFSKCFPSNISFWILKFFVFPSVAHFLGKELVEEKPSEVLTVYILGSAL